jgi:hemin uptake protein HemP
MTKPELAVALVAGLMSEAEPTRLETATSTLTRWTSSQLLAGQRESVIEHNGVEYRLRLTGQGKLILTK